MAARDIVHALAVRDYRWLWIGSLGGQFAMNMQMVARGWLVYSLTESALDLAWVTLSLMLPQAIFSLWGGVVADRLRKQRIIVAAQSTNCLLTAGMAAVIFLGHVEMWHFLVLGVCNGTILALSMPARQAYVPELLPEKLIITGMALNMTSWNLARILGPSLGGILIAVLADGNTSSTYGVGVVYCLISALYGFAALTVLRVSQPGLPRDGDGQTPWQDVVDGLRYVRGSPAISGLLLLSVVPFLFGMPLNTLLPAFNESVLGGGPEDLGFLISCMGDLKNKGRWLVGSCLAWGFFTLLFGVTRDVIPAALTVGAVGWVSAWNMALNRGLLQSHVDAVMRGRIMSVDMMAHGLMPLGVLPISLIADNYGLGIALETAGVAFMLVVAVLALFTPAVRHVRQALA